MHINYQNNKCAQTEYLSVFVLFPCCEGKSLQINVTDSQRGKKKYLDLFVWDSTIAMSEGGGHGNSFIITTGAQNSLSHLLLRYLPLYRAFKYLFGKFKRLSSWVPSSQFLQKYEQCFLFLQSLKGKFGEDRFGTLSYGRMERELSVQQ